MTIDEANRTLLEADIIVSETEVTAVINRMAHEISARLDKTRPIVCCIMNGGLIFAGQLLTKLIFPLEVDYLHATRYGHATEGAELNWLVKHQLNPFDRTILLLDDILDEGITLAAISQRYRQQGAREIVTAVLVDKQHKRKVSPGYRADFTGIDADDRFLFGCGMDYRGFWRNLPGIYALNRNYEE